MHDKTQIQTTINSDASHLDKITELEQQLKLNADCLEAIPLQGIAENCGVDFIQWFLGHRPESTERLLFAACSNANLKTVRWLLGNKADVSATDDHGRSGLHYAAKGGCVKILDELVQAGLDINKGRNNGITPLMVACAEAQLEAVKWLIVHKADIHAIADNNSSALHAASKSGYVPILNELVKQGLDVNQKASSGMTPLLYACLSAKQEAVLWLLAHGANVDITDDWGNSAFHYAVHGDNVQIMEELVRHGLNIHQKDSYDLSPLLSALSEGKHEAAQWLITAGADIGATDEIGRSALHYAAQKGHIKFMEELVQRNANLDQRDNEGFTPLLLAFSEGQFEAGQWLFEHEANVDVIDGLGYSALHYAAVDGQIKIMKELLQRGLDVNEKSKNGSTPLLLACGEGELETVQWLLVHKAMVHVNDDQGCSALHYAAEAGHVQTMEELLKQGLDINQDDHLDRTPLMGACANGELEAVQWLMAHQANIHVTDMLGISMLHMAAKGGQIEIIKELVARGLNVNQKSEDGHTPLMDALWQENYDVLLGLTQLGADYKPLIRHAGAFNEIMSEGDVIEVLNLCVVRALKDDNRSRLKKILFKALSTEKDLQCLDKMMSRLMTAPQDILSADCQIDESKIHVLFSSILALEHDSKDEFLNRMGQILLENREQSVFFQAHEMLLYACVFFNASKQNGFLSPVLAFLLGYSDGFENISALVQNKTVELMGVIVEVKQVHMKFCPHDFKGLSRFDAIYHSAVAHVVEENTRLREHNIALHSEIESLKQTQNSVDAEASLGRLGFFEKPLGEAKLNTKSFSVDDGDRLEKKS